MGKAFEKQTKTIEDQGQKQVDVLESLKPKERKKKAVSNNTTISKGIYDEILEERMDEILKMSREINYSNLNYDFKGLTSSINFTKFGDPMYNLIN